MKAVMGSRLGKRESRQRGAMLIIALLFLTLLSLLAVTFASLMRLERKAARNFVDTQTAAMVLHSAVDAVAAQLRGGVNYRHYTPAKSPWIFRDPRSQGQVGAGKVKIEEITAEELQRTQNPQYFQGFGILEPVKGVARSAYRCKVIDCASQINLNCGLDNLAMMLENLGAAIALKHRKNPLAVGNRLIRGIDVVRYRRKLEGGRFESKSQLEEIIGSENFELLNDFVTVHSWIDNTVGKNQTATELVIRAEQQGGSDISNLQRQTVSGVRFSESTHPEVYGTHNVGLQPRAPINLNTASEEVLTAVIAGIACRRRFPFVERSAATIGQQDISEGYTPEGNDRFPTAARGLGGGNEEIRYRIRPLWVYTPRIRLEQARMIAMAIRAQRQRTSFICWRSGSGFQGGGFEDFINTRLPQSAMPNPRNVVVIDPYNPTRGRMYEGTIRAGGGGNAPVRSLWSGGHPTNERTLRQSAGLPYHAREAWFYEMIKAAINANFNPNARLNKSGVNRHAALCVDKSDLVSPWSPILRENKADPQRFEVYAAHTTEFCFDSCGFYEITALAEIDEAFDIAQQLAKPRIFRKARAVVKVFEVKRHTTQYQFAKQFNHGMYTSKRGRTTGRENVMTFPEPLIGVTDYMSSGSEVDGNIQLMGSIDAEKVKLNGLTRDRWFQNFSNVLLGHSFMFRKSKDENYLIQRIKTGFRSTGQETTVENNVDMGGMGQMDSLTMYLKSVLDAEFSYSGEQFRRRYEMWPSRNGNNPALTGAGMLKQVIQSPRLSETAFSFDNLRPDGLHTNVLNAPTRNNGILMYPASGLTATRGWSVGERTHSPGEQFGNVDYYNGGIAFWIRFDFDADDPIFSGLVGCTQVVRRVGEGPQDSEGNQFYVFKTSFGELRVVRMYYHRAFSREGQLLPPPKEMDEAAAAGGEEEEDVEKDVNKAYARSEALADISGWKKGEWHHVAVAWNDLDHSTNRVRVFIDFQAAEAKTGVSYGLLGEDNFCSLNTRVPYDEFTIGGIIRRQAVEEAGIFKFAFNLMTHGGSTSGATSTAGVGGSGVFYADDLKIFPANATIDEFVSFTGPFESFLSTKIGRTRAYYHRNGTYHNCFELTFPKGVRSLRMRSFNWTEYQPVMYHGAGGNVTSMREQPSRATVFLEGQRVVFNMPPWLRMQRSSVSQNRIAGRVFRRPTGRGIAQEAVKLVYRFDIYAATGMGAYSGLSLATPVIDDVTLTYFLPSVELLSWEDLPVDYRALSKAGKTSGSSK